MKLRSRRFFFAPVALGLAALAASPLSLTDENENYRQLQTMPRERRVTLFENLQRLDKLSPAEQASIRALNLEIARTDPLEQLKYRSVMRSYQLWVNGLSEDQKEALRGADDPEVRFNLALKYRKEQQAVGSAAQRIHGVRTGYYGLKGPYETAQLLRIWNKMTLAQKNSIESHVGTASLEAEIHEMNRQHLGVKGHPFPIADEKHYEAQIEANDEFKRHIGIFKARSEADRLKKPDAPAAKTETEKAKTEANRQKKAEAAQMRIESVFAQFLYFEDPVHKPKPVSQPNLEKFSEFCPTWFHTMIDPLSADDARNYLTIVYRLIFTDSADINDEWKPAREKLSLAPGAPRPAPKRSATPAPF